DEAVAMLDAYFAAQFEGGRHEHRIEKMAIPCGAAGDAAK
ncbi:ribose-5-phosphate isomerase, partial [Proteus mirabilis]|nr:ribose-5-phosphate isomerase [Proteus mirabilis]